MDHPQTYLLNKIANNETNGLHSLGSLNGKHIKDLCEVMKSYAEESMFELIERLNKGEFLDIGGHTVELGKPRKRKN